MIEILASNSERFSVGANYVIRVNLLQKPTMFIGLFGGESVEFNSLKVEILDEESSKSFLGSAGIGLVGGALLGPLGLIAGALAGGNNKSGIFALTFGHDELEVKLVVKSNSKSEVSFLKEKAFAAKIPEQIWQMKNNSDKSSTLIGDVIVGTILIGVIILYSLSSCSDKKQEAENRNQEIEVCITKGLNYFVALGSGKMVKGEPSKEVAKRRCQNSINAFDGLEQFTKDYKETGKPMFPPSKNSY